MIEVRVTSERGDDILISVPESMEEMNGKQFMKTIEVLERIPEFLLSFLSLTVKEKEQAFAEFTEEEILTILDFYLDLLAVVTGKNLDALRDLPLLDDKGGSIFGLGGIVMRFISDYKPTERKEFEHRGQRFLLPELDVLEISNVSQKTWGPNMKTGEVIEALQRAKIFSAKGPDDKPQIADGLFYSDLGMIASLARRVDASGKEERKPLGLSAYSDFVNKRMTFFEDLPANILRDAAFFLWNSSRTSALTHIRASSLKTTRQQRRTRKKRRESGTSKSK